MRYRRSPSVFSESSASWSFLRTTPAKNPRTECCCQPVAFMIAAMVAPSGRLTKQPDHRGLLRIASRFALVRFLRGGGFGPAFAADRTLYLARALTLGQDSLYGVFIVKRF